MVNDYFIPIYCILPKKCVVKEIFISEWRIGDVHTIDKESYVSSEVQEVLLPDLVSDNPATGKSTNLWLSACFCMYSMKLILESNWRFASERDIISEDVYSLLRLYRNVEKVTIIPEAFYYYCENSTSLTHTYKAAQNDEAVQAAVKNVAEALGDTGRILVRESGTEPVVRVMVEAPDHDTCQKYVSEVVDVIRDRGYSL